MEKPLIVYNEDGTYLKSFYTVLSVWGFRWILLRDLLHQKSFEKAPLCVRLSDNGGEIRHPPLAFAPFFVQIETIIYPGKWDVKSRRERKKGTQSPLKSYFSYANISF